MNYMEILTEQDAAALVALLAETFKVKAPALRFNARNRRGYYYPSKRLISISRFPKAKTVVHEFAHYLDHVETGRSSGRQANDREWHSQGFYYKLRKIVLACGGEYPWRMEYRQIARWAQQQAEETRSWHSPAIGLWPRWKFKEAFNVVNLLFQVIHFLP